MTSRQARHGKQVLRKVQDDRSAVGRLFAPLPCLVLGVSLFALDLAGQEPTRRLAILLDVNGVIGPATSDYVSRGLEKARDRGATLVIIRMDTPGGLDTSMRGIIQDIIASPIPVVSYVRTGGRAASAGTYILYASHVSAMAPGSNLGAATPVQIGAPRSPIPFPMPEPPEPDKDGDEAADQEHDETKTDDGDRAEERRAKPPAGMKEKIVNDAAAYIRGLAQMRGRNVEWAEKAVREAASLSAEDAKDKNVIDVIAEDVPDLLAKIDGREVQVNGQTIRLETASITVEAIEPDWRTKLLAIITNPNVASILMTFGMLGLFIELQSPGLIFPGVVGAICLLLAFYAFHLLPINYAGLALIVLGMALILSEAFMPSFGIVGIGGLAAFVIGSVLLIDTDVPGYGVSWELIGSVSFIAGASMLLLLTFFMRIRKRPVVAGPEHMIGGYGRVIDWHDRSGRVRTQGEIWQARADAPLDAGQSVRVTKLDGLRIVVEPESPSDQSGDLPDGE